MKSTPQPIRLIGLLSVSGKMLSKTTVSFTPRPRALNSGPSGLKNWPGMERTFAHLVLCVFVLSIELRLVSLFLKSHVTYTDVCPMLPPPMGINRNVIVP